MFDIVLIFAQNIDCRYALEPPGEAVLKSTHYLFLRKNKKNGYTPAYLSFSIYKNSAEVDIAPASGKITKNMKYRSRAPG